MKMILTISCILGLAGSALAQDFHFVQTLSLPQLVNPAAVGHQSLYRSQFAALYRGQWDNVGSEKSYQGAAVVADMRFCLENQAKNFFALGLALQHDWSPLGGLSNSTGRFSGSYHLNLDGETYASVGAYLGVLGYQLDPDRLKFNAQYIGGNYQPGASNGESFSRIGALRADLGSGLEIYNNLQAWSAGIAWQHVNKPGYSLFDDDENRLGIGWVLHFSYTAWPSNKRSWLFRGLYRKQSFSGTNSKQWQSMFGVFRQVNYTGNLNTKLSAGAYFRLGSRSGTSIAVNTFVPVLQLGNDNFTAVLSYDIHMQKMHSRFAGGLELGLVYSFGETDRCVACRGPGL